MSESNPKPLAGGSSGSVGVVYIRAMSGEELMRLDAPPQVISLAQLAEQIAGAVGCAESQLQLVLHDKILGREGTLELFSSEAGARAPLHITVVKHEDHISVGAFVHFNNNHHEVSVLQQTGKKPSSVVTKIGDDERRSYAAIAAQLMNPRTGKWWWSIRIIQTSQNIIMMGVCTGANAHEHPNTTGLRFTERGAAFECWNGFACGLHETLGYYREFTTETCTTDDVVTFCLDTDRGNLRMWKNGALLGVVFDDLMGEALRAHIELEHPGDSVELLGETLPVQENS